MRKMIKEVFLGVRFLVSLYFLLISFSLEPQPRSFLVISTALYFSLSLLAYLKFEKVRVINKLLDLPFLPVLVYLSGHPSSVHTFIPLIVVHTPRSPWVATFLLAEGIAISTYLFITDPLTLFSSLILLISAPISGMIPDFISTIRKDRDSMKRLRSSYRKFLQDFARWERDRREMESLRFLLDTSTSSGDFGEFLEKVKEHFKLKSIRITPKRNIDDFSVLKDKDKGLLVVPVKLEEGYAVVIFELESPFQLNDDVLVSMLEKSGRMISLFIAGFEEEGSLERSIKIG